MNVEIKLTVVAADAPKILQALALTDDAAEHRDVFFFDTADLALYGRGLILRARREKGAGDDVTVKVRGGDPKTDGFAGMDGFKVEADRTETKSLVSASFTVKVDGKDIAKVVEGTRAVRELFTDAQRAFVEKNGGAPWDGLVVLGPLPTSTWKVPAKQAAAVNVNVTVEKWTIAGADLVELSARVDEVAGDATLKSLHVFLAQNAAHTAPAQQTKTQAALQSLLKERLATPR